MHVDIKEGPGIDVVADLTDRAVGTRLSELGCRSVLCSNLLEHIEDREEVSRNLLRLVRPRGYVIVTVPFRYPYHADPIDTLFRPSLDELLRLFPGTDLHRGEIVAAGTFGDRHKMTRWQLAKATVRCLLAGVPSASWTVPPAMWPYLVRPFRVTCAILRKRA